MVTKRSYLNCKGENNVISYEIRNGGHSWPGAQNTGVTRILLGNTNEDINAGEETWNFFKTKTLRTCNTHLEKPGIAPAKD
jgi:poly(3-hydroxybutyrate) depolymerase